MTYTYMGCVHMPNPAMPDNACLASLGSLPCLMPYPSTPGQLRQARLTLPVLLVVLAVTPPLLLRSAGERDEQHTRRGQRPTPAWQVSLCSLGVLDPSFRCMMPTPAMIRQHHTAFSGHACQNCAQQSTTMWCSDSHRIDTHNGVSPVLQGLVQALGVALAVLHARFAVFEVLQRLAGGRPTEAVLVGCLLLGVAAGCAPVVACQHPTSQRAQRWLALLAATGALLVLLRPPLPFKVLTEPSSGLGLTLSACDSFLDVLGFLLSHV